MALNKVTNPELLAQLGSPTGNLIPVSDPDLLKQLNGEPSDDPGLLKSGAAGLMSGIPGAETAVAGVESLGDKTFKEAHEGLEDLKNKAWEAHPVAYGAGKGVGMVGTGLALPEVASLEGAAGLGAGIGGLSGLDEASNATDAVKDVAKGAGTGAILGTIGHGISKAVEAAPDAIKRGLAALGKETTTDDINRYLANPDVINAAPSKAQIGDTVSGLTNDITKASGQLSTEARGLLSGSKGLDIKDLKDLAIEAVGKYHVEGNPATAADESAIKTIISQYQKLADIAETNGGTVPQTTLRSIIDHIQAATKESTYGNPEAGTVQKALKEFGGKLNDALRESNPDYAAGMAPSAEAAKLSSGLQDTFSLEGGKPTDTTINKVGRLLKEGKPEEASLAQQLKDMTGTDIMEMLQNSTTKEALNAPGSGEAMKALLATLGFGAGKFTGVPYGGIAGAAAGRFSANAFDGGGLAKRLMNMYLSGKESYGSSMIKPFIDKFGPVLINAAKAGGNQLAATHFVLATSDPDYQQAIDHLQQNQEEQ